MPLRSVVLPVVGLAALGSSAVQAGGFGCEACYRYVVEKPVYDVVAEPVMVRAPQAVARTVPAEYRTVAETALVPGRKVWQVRRDARGRKVGGWVLTPARYEVRHRTVMVQPPRVIPAMDPGVYAMQPRTVLVQPGKSGWEPLASPGGVAIDVSDRHTVSYGPNGN